MMLDFSALEAPVRSPYFLIAVGTIVISYFLNWLVNGPKKLELPWAAPAKNGILVPSFREATKKYPEEPFILPESGHPYVVLPLSVLEEVKSLPDSAISLSEEVTRKLHGKYTSVGQTNHDAFANAMKIDVNRKHTDQIISDVQDEIVYAFNIYFGSFPTWTEIAPYPKILMVIAAFSARVFVGLPLCRDQAWLGSTITFANNVMMASRAVSKVKPIWRGIVAPWIKEVKALKQCFAFAAVKLAPQFEPIVKAYREKAKLSAGARISVGEGDEGKYNLLYWILKHEARPERVTTEAMAKEQMSVAFGAIHTTGMRTINAIFDLAAHPEYAAELREEYEKVMKEEGSPDGKFTKQSLAKLKKLDSFMLESVRMNPSALTNMVRMVIAPKGITLSNGSHFPYGTSLCFPFLFSPYALNPPASSLLLAKGQPPLSEFHPFRFSKIRENPGQEDKFQFTTLAPENMSFGAGNHACPGRFFASNNIKCLMIELLKRYDIGVLDGGKGVKYGGKRPEPVSSEMGWYTNPGSKIWIRSRKL